MTKADVAVKLVHRIAALLAVQPVANIGESAPRPVPVDGARKRPSKPPSRKA
jgi:methyl coenzyme M reductase subunit D